MINSEYNFPRAENDHNYVVIGSSFCAAAFITRLRQREPAARFLVLERGTKYLSEHNQLSSKTISPGEVEITPWHIAEETTRHESVTSLHGQIPFLGGRSAFWSGWCPTPSDEELAGWPEQLTSQLQEIYFRLAADFLGVISADQIHASAYNHRLYGLFQRKLKECLDDAADIDSVQQVLHAPLAMGNKRSMKFCVSDMLISMDNVTVIRDCNVTQILHDGQAATALRTDRGEIIPLYGSKLVLAMSTLPATTLVFNSFDATTFPQLSQVGKRFTAHTISSVIARVPRSRFVCEGESSSKIELGAVYIAGIKDNAQYHLQLSSLSYGRCSNAADVHSLCRKYSANSIPVECIDASRDAVVVSCSTLGELDHKNQCNQFSPTGELTFRLNEQDKAVQDWMEKVTFETISKLSSSVDRDDLEYWHELDNVWKMDLPAPEHMRKKSLVHDASTMWIGDDDDADAPVGLDYRLRGVENVYITGGALWPTGGSWNPVLTIVAMAMHLADTI